MVHVAHAYQFFQIITDILTLVISAALQLARGDLIVCNIEYKQSLHRVNLDHPNPLKFIFDNIQQQTMEPLDWSQTLQVMGHKTLAGFRIATN
jgi:hypothetical protein